MSKEEKLCRVLKELGEPYYRVHRGIEHPDHFVHMIRIAGSVTTTEEEAAVADASLRGIVRDRLLRTYRDMRELIDARIAELEGASVE